MSQQIYSRILQTQIAQMFNSIYECCSCSRFPQILSKIFKPVHTQEIGTLLKNVYLLSHLLPIAKFSMLCDQEVLNQTTNPFLCQSRNGTNNKTAGKAK